MQNDKTAQNVRSGQAMLEYLLAFVLMLGVFGAAWALVGVMRSNGERTHELVSSPYP